MGSIFGKAKVTGHSVLSEQQERLLLDLIDQVSGTYGQEDPVLNTLQDALFRSTTGEGQALSERIFNDALLNPALNAFERDVAPSIAGDFASVGGTLSSRRGSTLARARTDIVNQAQSSLAGILPQVLSFPLQQTLGQIQGYGELVRQRETPFQRALTLALTPTQSVQQQSPGPGWAIATEAIKAGALAAAACWVAGRLYGENSPQQRIARYWIFGVWSGPLARMCQWLYLKLGKRVAHSRVACELLRPLFDRAVTLGVRQLWSANHA